MMRLIPIAVLLWSTAAIAQSVPIRGATGGGYGQFRWGTSLATVEKLSPKLQRYTDAEQSVREKQAIQRLRRARAKMRGRKAARISGIPKTAALDRYRYWLTLNGLRGRVELAFFKQQLFEVTVRIVYKRSERKKETTIVRRLIKKYGLPQPDETGERPTLKAQQFRFLSPGGDISVARLPASKAMGLLEIVYRGTDLSLQVETYLDKLQEMVARYAPRRSKRLPRKASPKRRSGGIEQHI